MAAPKLAQLKVKLFTDGADKAQIVEMAKQPWIAGFTTNPSLLKKAGVSDYAAYARDLVAAIPDRHISFEVFSDDIPEMVAQARRHHDLGQQCLCKVAGDEHARRAVVRRGAHAFARRRQDQHDRDLHARAGRACRRGAGGRCASLRFGIRRPAGRFGIDYRPIMQDAIARARQTRNVEIIWASTREVFNVVEADDMGCHIITAPADVLKKLPALGTQNVAPSCRWGSQILPRRRRRGRSAARGSGVTRSRIDSFSLLFA